ncbi:hypothetical protein RFI_39837, partial [Reticulomyxa filosa]
KLPVCDDIAPFNYYAYVRINDVILFFGGWNCKNGPDEIISKSVHKYSIRENKWMIFQNTLSSPLDSCVAILSEDNTYVHIIGGSTHVKIEVREWLSEEEMKKGIELKVEEKEKEKKKNEMETIVNKVKKDNDVEHCFITGKLKIIF